MGIHICLSEIEALRIALRVERNRVDTHAYMVYTIYRKVCVRIEHPRTPPRNILI